MIPNKVFFVSAILLSLTLFGALAIGGREVPVVVQTNLERLPLDISGFQGTEDSFPEAVYRILNADKNVYRHYRSPDGRQVDLYIGYYGTAKGGRTGHNPYACLPGSGWAIVDTGKVRLTSDQTPKGIPVGYIKARKDGINIIMLHWYQADGTHVMSSGLQMNIQRFMGRVFRNRNDGAFVRISLIADEENVPRGKLIAKNFAEKIIALLPQYWPIEK